MGGPTIRALVCKALGSPTQPLGGKGPLHIVDEHPQPPLTPNGVRIRVEAASLNFADALQVQGQYQERPKLPFIPGAEVSGEVVAVGGDVRTIKVGEKVCAVSWTGGAFAEELVVPENYVLRLPSGIDLAAAAGLPVAFGTSSLALIQRAHVQQGQVVLVLGAGGGVGVAAVQIAKARGARVIAVARGEKKQSVLKDLGADLVIDSGSDSMRSLVKKFAPGGVDVLYDPVGGAAFSEALKTLRWGAQVLIIGFASGHIPKIPANVALVKNLTVHGIYWGSYAQHQPRALRKSLEDSVTWLAEGKVKVPISHRFSLEEAPEAFKALMSREAVGKVIVYPTKPRPQSRL